MTLPASRAWATPWRRSAGSPPPRAPFIVNAVPELVYLADILWNATGRPDKTGWYRDAGLPQDAAMQAAATQRGYGLWGVMPFLVSQQTNHLPLQPILHNEEMFHRAMVSVVVSPAKFPSANRAGAVALQKYFLTPATQALIRNYRYPGLDHSLFWPAGPATLPTFCPYRPAPARTRTPVLEVVQVDNQTVTDPSSELAGRAARVLPGGVTHVARAYSPPLYVARSEGSHKWLVDGRMLIDYTMGHGALLLGHVHPAVVAAVRDQVGRGTHYGAGHPLEVEWAERICALVGSVDEVRFTASGTEAAMLAVRVARAATGRDVLVKLDGHFHGWSDAVGVNLVDGEPRTACGVPAAQLQTTTVVRTGDVHALRNALDAGNVAALIFEGSGAHYGRDPLPPEYAQTLRTECDRTGALLIIDEVVTGFRVATGGMQSLLSITPDLSMFGKVMAGGLPAGALGGRRELMELLASTIEHPGTFNANPLTAAAGIATLDICATGAPQEAASETARQLESEWREVMQRRGVDGRVWRLASIIHLQLADPSAQATLAGRMRAEGVDLLHTSAFCSAVHTEEDVAASVAALDRALTGAAAQAPA